VILPTKRLPQDRALLAVGADVLLSLSRPQTVSKLWDEIKQNRLERRFSTQLPFDWFLLSLSLLFAIGAVELIEGRVHKARR
jgi:ABC-3C biological conflict system middle component